MFCFGLFFQKNKLEFVLCGICMYSPSLVLFLLSGQRHHYLFFFLFLNTPNKWALILALKRSASCLLACVEHVCVCIPLTVACIEVRVHLLFTWKSPAVDIHSRVWSGFSRQSFLWIKQTNKTPCLQSVCLTILLYIYIYIYIYIFEI